MTVRVVVPYDAADPKTRLADILDAEERAAFGEAMLQDVVAAIDAAGAEPEVLATASVDLSVPVTVDDQSLTPAVNTVLADATDPVAVVMADLPLATPAAVSRLFDAQGEVVLVPGIGGGTNAFLTRSAAFRVDYHGASIQDHRRTAAPLDGAVTELDSFRLSMDIDEPVDLPEVLLHADGRAATWLHQRFTLETQDDRVTVIRR